MAYVDRDQVRDMLHREIEAWGSSAEEIDALLKANDELFKLPEADVAPVVYGHWITTQDNWTVCSECKALGSPQWKGCPVCLARMDGE